MGFSTNQPVVSARQRGTGRGENNVVTAGIPTGKKRTAMGRHAGVKLGLPAGGQPHLLAVQAVAEAGQPSALMWSAYRDNVVHSAVCLHGLQPGAGGQSTH